VKVLVNYLLFIISLFSIQTVLAVHVVELAGDKSYPPYSYRGKGPARGVYGCLLNKAFSRMPEYQIKYNMMPWKRAIVFIKQGKIAGFFPPYYSKERTAWTKFSQPILSETTIVFAKEEFLQDKNKYPDDFYGSTVCFNRGFGHETMGGKQFASAVKNNKIHLIEANDNKACLSRVARGMADFYINDQLIDKSKFPMIIKGMKTRENFGHIGYTLKTTNYPFLNDLQKKFNQVIKLMKENGEIDEIVKKYW